MELHKRKKDQDSMIAGRSRARSEYREKRLHAPQREDERLTNPTITQMTRTLQTGPVPDPDRAARVAASAQRVQAKELAREERRRDALHTLYMHARTFITTEEQLDAQIEKIFVPDPHTPGVMDDSIWTNAAPPTIADMLSNANGSSRKAVEYHAGPAALTGRRIKKIAEELTGGKMD